MSQRQVINPTAARNIAILCISTNAISASEKIWSWSKNANGTSTTVSNHNASIMLLSKAEKVTIRGGILEELLIAKIFIV